MATAGDVQKLFLQAVISRRVVPIKLAKILWQKSIEAVNAADADLGLPFKGDQASWDNFVKKINESLNTLDLEFRHLHDEQTGREMLALVNRRGDEVAQIATEYSAQEIAYFKAIVEQIMLAPHESFSVSSLLALREVTSLKLSMTKTQAEIVLTSFVARGWLAKSKRGRYSLSTRTLLELQSYLRATYPDEILECTICMEILTRGTACYTRNCKTRLHQHCLATYRRRNAACPTCGCSWADGDAAKLLPVGEDAVKEGQDDGRRRTRRQDSDDEDADDDEDVEGEVDYDAEEPTQSQSTQSQPRTQKKGRKGARAKAVDSDEEEEEVPEPSQRTQGARRSSRRQ